MDLKKQIDILNAHISILNKIGNSRVFDIEYDNEGFYIEEGCDFFFRMRLTSKDCFDLSEMFKDVGQYIKQYGD